MATAPKKTTGEAPKPAGGLAAGIIHVAPDGMVLLLHRSPSEENYGSHWALPGGRGEDGESPEECADRECREEIGYSSDIPLKLLDQRETPNGMQFHTFVRPTFDKFTPKLNDEHSGHLWTSLDKLPSPLHPAVARTLHEKTGGDGVKLQKWAHSGGDKPLMAQDLELAVDLAFDYAPSGIERHGFDLELTGAQYLKGGIAFDRDSVSVRETDDFDRLHVKRTPISKAGVNPYYGREIPRFKELGLDPDRVYKLLRDPDELRKGAATFNNIPLLVKHQPHAADAHDDAITGGTVGSNAEYEHPYLYNSLGIWRRDAIDHVEKKTQKELSSAYGYNADMTPGVYEGEDYDGVMRDLKGNHVCLVKKGRAGSDVVVGDEALQPKLEIRTMAKLKSLKAGVALGALRAHLLANVKLAQDAAIIDMSPVFATIKVNEFGKALPNISAAVRAGLKGKLAQDGDLGGIVAGVETLMKAVDGDKSVDDAEIPEGEGTEEAAAEDDAMAAIKAYLAEAGVSPEIIAGMPGEAAEEDVSAEDGKLEAGPEGAGGGKPGKLDPAVFDKGAMDSAIAKVRADTIATMNAIGEAKEAVRPVVGEIKIAMDSAAAVYQQAFKMTGRADMAKVKDLGALKAAWGMVPVPGAPRPRQIAQDEAAGGAADFSKTFPHMAKVKRI
jgi:8-oxo-dGTP pyrophosphatase MutT (NUDIX family)